MTGFRDDSLSYQLSVPVNPGNNGAPVFNKYGKVIGIIHGKHTLNEWVAFALKSNFLKLSLIEVPSEIKDLKGKLSSSSSIAYKNKTSPLKSITPSTYRLKVTN